MSTKGIRIPIEFLTQLDEAQAAKVEERLDRLFDDRSLDVGTDGAEADLERILGLLADAKVAATGIEVTADTTDVVAKLSDAAAALDALGGTDVDISVSDTFVGDIRKLAGEYDRVVQESQAIVTAQEKALAAMRLAGQEGTEGYRKVSQELGTAKARLQEITDAAAAPDEGGFFQKLFGGPDGGINFLALSEGAAQVEEFFTGIIEKGTEYKDAFRAVQVQTGATAEEMERYEGIARRAFSAGVGDGPAEALKNIGTTVQVFGKGLSDGALEELTVGLGRTAKAFEKEFSEVAGRAATFQKSFKTSSSETVGLITLALQGARTPADDVLDTIGEYSPLMEQAGFSAREFIGILTTAGGGAAFNTDKLADTIKETSIRLKEGDITAGLDDLVANFSDRVPSALMASLNGIAQAGAAGSKTVKDVLLDSTREIERAYAEGTIDENIRKKLQSTFAGTPAEEFGADLYARAFGAPIDEHLIAAKAAAAQAVVEGTFNPGLAEKFGRAFEFVEQRAAATFVPLAKAGAAVADMAPKFAAIKAALPDSVVKNLETSLTNAAGKSMDLLTGKLGGVQTLLKGLGPAFLGPWGIAIGAAAGLLTLFFTQTEAGQAIWSSIVDGVTEFYDAAKPALDAIVDVLGTAGTLLYEVFIAQFELAADVVGGVLDLVMSLFSAGDGGDDGLKEFFASIMAGAEQAEVFIRGIIAAFRSLKENVGDALRALVTGDISGFLGALGNIGEETSTAFQSGIDAAARDLKVEHLQKRVSSALEIKGDLDENDAVGQLVAKYTAATDDMTRRNLAGQIAQQIPGAVTGLTTVVDAATGEVQELYDISLEKAQEFVDGQNRVLSQQVGSGQGAFIALLSEQSQMVDEQKSKLQALADQIVETGKRGGDTSRLTEEYQKQREAVEKQADALQNTVVQGKGLGITAQNIQEIALRAGKTTEEATRLGASFVEAKKKTDDLAHSAKVLGDTFRQALSGIDGQLTTAIGAASGAQLQLQRLRKELKETTDTDRRTEIERDLARYQKDYAENRTEAVALGREQVNLQQLEAGIQRDVAKGQESSLTRGQRALDQLGKNIELTTRLFDLRQREDQIRTGRDANAFDELRKATFELQNQQDVLDALITKYRVPKDLARALFDELRTGTKDVDVNALAIKVGLRAEEKDGRFDLKAEVLQQFASVYENELNVLDIRTRIGREALDPTALADLARQIEEQQFQIELELGIKTNVDLAERIGGQIEAVQTRAAALRESMDAVNVAIAGDEQNAETRLQNEAKLLDIQKQLAELTLAEGELRTSERAAFAALQDERIAKVQETYDRELALASRRFDEEQVLAGRFIDTYQALTAAGIEERRDMELEAIGEVLAARLSAIDEETAQREQQLDLLEQYGLLGDEGIDTERELMDRRLAIQREAEERRKDAEARAQAEREATEREAQKRLLVQEQQAAGERLAVEARRARAELQLERDKLREEQRLRREKALLTGDQNELRLAESMGRQLDDLNRQIEEKGALTVELTGTLSGGLADAFAGLFANNEEQMKDSFRGMFSVLAGALKKLATSFVLDIILQSPFIKGLIALNPFLGAGITATATGVLTGLVNAVLNPVIGSLLSFASGGRVDQPTLALVGDASRLGGRDREWWLRDEQLWGIVSSATAVHTAAIREGLDRIEAAILGERIVGRLAGSVMYLLTQNGRQEIQRRQRG